MPPLVINLNDDSSDEEMTSRACASGSSMTIEESISSFIKDMRKNVEEVLTGFPSHSLTHTRFNLSNCSTGAEVEAKSEEVE